MINKADRVIFRKGGLCYDVGKTGLSYVGSFIARWCFEDGECSDSSEASGMVAQYLFRTCLSAGLRMGLGRKKSMPESRHSLTLLSSEKAVKATIGAE